MTQHPMRYVAMSEHVLSTHTLSESKRRRLRAASNAIADAESALVTAYCKWHDIITEIDSAETRRILELVRSDLT